MKLGSPVTKRSVTNAIVNDLHSYNIFHLF